MNDATLLPIDVQVREDAAVGAAIRRDPAAVARAVSEFVQTLTGEFFRTDANEVERFFLPRLRHEVIEP